MTRFKQDFRRCQQIPLFSMLASLALTQRMRRG